MKKKQNKLGVARDTIRTLTQGELHQVPGGAAVNPSGQGNSCVRSCTTDHTTPQ
jgi:hypothetical protein